MHLNPEAEERIRNDFNALMNLEPAELKAWLKTAESRKVGTIRRGETESVGRQSARKILAIRATPVGDLKEMEAVRAVFGDKPPMISSTKSLTGHSLGAAGAQEAIYSLLMLNNGFACESAHIEELDPAFEDLPILRKREDRELNCVLSNSFGFGGTNATLAFTRVAA